MYQQLNGRVDGLQSLIKSQAREADLLSDSPVEAVKITMKEDLVQREAQLVSEMDGASNYPEEKHEMELEVPGQRDARERGQNFRKYVTEYIPRQ